MIKSLAAVGLFALVSCQSAGPARDGDASSRIRETTRQAMKALAEGRFIEPTDQVRSGWIMENEAGKSHHRATLNDQAAPLIGLGMHAVPELATWLDHGDMHMRYIACKALQEITGLSPYFPHFATLEEHATHDWLKEGRRAWLGWYERQQ